MATTDLGFQRTPPRRQWQGWLGLLLQAVSLSIVIGMALALLVALGAGAAHAQVLAPAGAGANDAPTNAGGRSGAFGRAPAVAAAQTQLAQSGPGRQRDKGRRHIAAAPGRPLPHSLAQLPRSDSPPAGAALLFHTTAGLVSAPLQSTRVRFTVTGTIVRATIQQRYRNPSEDWLDASYQFPLPDDAAVDSLRLRVGHRLIEGEIQARAKARQTFERARRRGQRAALVRQDRPNVFVARVANIEPWSEIDVEFEYQQALALGDSGWVLRFPTVVAPRYTPDPRKSAAAPLPLLTEVAHRPGQIHPQADRGKPAAPSPRPTTGVGAGLAEPPTLLFADARANRIQIEVRVQAGIPVTRPVSPSHEIAVERLDAPVSDSSDQARAPDQLGAGPAAAPGPAPEPGSDPIDPSARGYHVRFEAAALADRDFVLQWRPAAGELTQASLQLEPHGQEWFGQLSIAPPAPQALDRSSLARELVFVIDTSGSMQGESITQARAALDFGLKRLQAHDRFNVIRFSDRYDTLFARSQIANAANLDRARIFVNGLEAEGGTEMAGALERALMPAIPAGFFLSQVVFVTDGAVSNEEQLFATMTQLLGQRRLFTVGIGSAPNSWFMRQAAAVGRGSFTHIGHQHQVEQVMARLFTQLAFPALTDLQLTDVNGEPIETGAPLRDLYAGDPIVASFRIAERPAAAFLSGRIGNKPWQKELTLIDAPESGIHKLWAKTELQTVADQIRQRAMRNRNSDDLREHATTLALNHKIVSAYTSLVAVDRTPARPAGVSSRNGQVPRQLPAGWQLNGVFGQAAQASLATGGLGLWLQIAFGLALLLIAALFAASFLTRAQDLVQVRS